jgi:hypothetical protein
VKAELFAPMVNLPVAAFKKDAAQCRLLIKVGRLYYFDPDTYGEFKEKCRVQEKAQGSTDAKTKACGSSGTAGQTSAQALSSLQKLKRPLGNTSPKKVAATVTQIREK